MLRCIGRTGLDRNKIKINREYLSYLQFADDMVLFSNDGNELQRMIGDLNQESIKVGLKMNMLKTKIMLSSLAQTNHRSRYKNMYNQVDWKGNHRRMRTCWSANGSHSKTMTGHVITRQVWVSHVLDDAQYCKWCWRTRTCFFKRTFL